MEKAVRHCAREGAAWVRADTQDGLSDTDTAPGCVGDAVTTERSRGVPI